MSPVPAIPGAVAAIKGATAKQMAAFAKAMQKTDWDGVNNAMESIKSFAESASLVQETLGDIKDQADALVNIALGTAMAQLATKFNEIFEQLEPLATGIDKLVIAMEDWGVKIFDNSKQLIDAKDPLNENEKALRDWWMTFWNSLNPDLWPLPDATGREIVGRGRRQMEELEGGY